MGRTECGHTFPAGSPEESAHLQSYPFCPYAEVWPPSRLVLVFVLCGCLAAALGVMLSQAGRL